MSEKANGRTVDHIPIGYVYSDGKKCYVLSHEQALRKDEFVPPGSQHTATVVLDVVLERILNKADGWKAQIDEMRGNK